MFNHAQLTLREIHGPYMQLLVNLQGEKGGMWLNALKRFNRKENPWDGKPLWPIWKTVTVGQYQDKAQMLDFVRGQGFGISHRAESLIKHPAVTLASEQHEVDLVCVSARQLGVVDGSENNAPYSVLLQGAMMYGLEPCSAEAVVQARLVFPEQQYEDDGQAYLMAMMKPLEVRKDFLCLELNHSTLYGEKRETTALHVGAYEPDSCIWSVDVPFIFTLPRQ
jgi:hypothetical protein